MIGRERGIELSGAIASNQRMMGYMPGMGMGGGMQGSMGPGMQGSMGPGMQGSMGVKVPPRMSGMQPQGPWMQGMQQGTKLPPIQGQNSYNDGLTPARSSKGAVRRSTSQRDLGYDNSDGEGAANHYSHVTSKYAQGAAEVGIAAKARSSKAPAKNARASKATSKGDRFAEAEKERGRAAMMARWN